jgi:hypothetical protein
MKKQVLYLIFFATTLSLIAQNSSKVQILSAPSTNLLSKEQVGFDMNAPKTLTCNDTLRYPQIKEQIIGNSSFALFELWASDLEEMSQTFLLSGTFHQISGIEFFGRKKPGPAPLVAIRASVYSVDANNNPIGPELGFGTISITDTNFTYRQINFTNSVIVGSNYAVVIKPTNGIVQGYINNPAPNQVYDENLSRVKSAYYPTSNNNWVSVLALTTDPNEFPQGPYDFEMIVAPKVSYTINTDFTAVPSPGCVGTPVALNNTTTPATLISNRMYNFSAMQMHFLNEPDSLYAWNPGVTPQVILWGTNTSYTYTSANNYNVTLYTLGGLWTSCSDQKTTSLTVGGAPAAPTSITGNNSVCPNSSNFYFVNPVPGATSYTWTLPSGWIGLSTSNSINATAGVNGGTITVTANNACGSSAAATLTVNVTPDDATFTYPSNTICVGSPNVTPNVNTPGGLFTSTPFGLVFANASTGEIDVASSVMGSYSITYTTAGPCPFSQTQTITITNSPDASFSYPSSSYCINASNPVPIITGSAGVFTSTPSGLSIVGGTGVINLSASTPGTYTVTNTIAASGSCPQVSDSVTVTVNPLPTATVTGGGPICAGGVIAVNIALTGTPPWNFTYSDGTNTTPVTGQTSSPYTINATTAGTYTVTTVTDANCTGGAGNGSVTVTVNPFPNVTVSNNANTLTANQAGATYQWIDCNNNNAPISGATNQSFTPTTSGSYAVVVTLNGCSDTSACQNVVITGVNVQALSNQIFSIYPNPNQGNFTIQSSKGGIFELIDLTGKVINAYSITNTQQTVQENLPAGMYFVREKESGVLQKLVVQ